jgi:parallel beta helix pectate lyase-like protein
MTRPRCIVAGGLTALLAGCSFGPSVLEVGPTARFKLPSEAAARARSGDTIHIAPSDYTDCAVIRASGLTIEATGEGATIGDKSCAGKGIFVIDGNDVTVRNITFQHAAVQDQNGAGIRAEGRNLTIAHCKFIDNENGILANPVHGSTIRILDSDFRGNGKCEGACAHGIYIGAIDRLEIAHSRFIDQHVGHHLKSRARTTVLIDNDVADGPNGNSSYLIDIPNGGDVLIQGNRLQKGKMSENTGTAVPIGEEGVTNPTNELVIRDNTFVSDLPNETVFVRNGTTTPAMLSGNHLQGRITPLTGPGSVTP